MAQVVVANIQHQFLDGGTPRGATPGPFASVGGTPPRGIGILGRISLRLEFLTHLPRGDGFAEVEDHGLDTQIAPADPEVDDLRGTLRKAETRKGQATAKGQASSEDLPPFHASRSPSHPSSKAQAPWSDPTRPRRRSDRQWS